jgi:hypothetical protein
MLMQCTRVENECEDRNGRIKIEDRTCDGFSRSISERRGLSLWLLEVPTEVSVHQFHAQLFLRVSITIPIFGKPNSESANNGNEGELQRCNY